MPVRSLQRNFFHYTSALFAFVLLTSHHCFAQENVETEFYRHTGVISGTCFYDTNQNGSRDAEDYGIAGITISLQRINLMFQRIEIETAVSDEAGRYEFPGLRRGFYVVEVQETAQWECGSRNSQLMVLTPFNNEKIHDAAFQKPLVQESFIMSEFQNNSMDTHMYWDGIDLWIPETEYLNNDIKYSTNLIRLNPDDFSYTRYILPRIDYNGETANTIVYEVVPSPSNSDILYVSAPYGHPKSIYVFNKITESADGYRLINEELVYGGNNGARMAVTTSGGNDTVWITANDSKIATFDVASATMTMLYDFSSVAPGGLLGIAAVPTATDDRYMMHVASFGGKLLIFPSDLTSVSQSITIDVAGYRVRNACLMALAYDEHYIWVAGYGECAGRTKLFIMRYVPASQFDVAGECVFFWSNASEGIMPSLVSYGNWVFAVVEHLDCSLANVLRLNKTTGVIDDIEIYFQNLRIAASLGHDDKDNIYVGGYGCSSESVRPLDLVRFNASGGQ